MGALWYIRINRRIPSVVLCGGLVGDRGGRVLPSAPWTPKCTGDEARRVGFCRTADDRCSNRSAHGCALGEPRGMRKLSRNPPTFTIASTDCFSLKLSGACELGGSGRFRSGSRVIRSSLLLQVEVASRAGNRLRSLLTNEHRRWKIPATSERPNPIRSRWLVRHVRHRNGFPSRQKRGDMHARVWPRIENLQHRVPRCMHRRPIVDRGDLASGESISLRINPNPHPRGEVASAGPPDASAKPLPATIRLTEPIRPQGQPNPFQIQVGRPNRSSFATHPTRSGSSKPLPAPADRLAYSSRSRPPHDRGNNIAWKRRIGNGHGLVVGRYPVPPGHSLAWRLGDENICSSRIVAGGQIIFTRLQTIHDRLAGNPKCTGVDSQP